VGISFNHYDATLPTTATATATTIAATAITDLDPAAPTNNDCFLTWPFVCLTNINNM
jgi:hypothetical protein